MEVLLDSSFIITAIRNNIDFLTELRKQGFEVKVPREVLDELKDLRLRTGHVERTAINIALALLEDKKIKKMKLGKRTVDEGLIVKGKEGVYIATLDNAIRRLVKNKINLSTATKGIVVDRS